MLVSLYLGISPTARRLESVHAHNDVESLFRDLWAKGDFDKAYPCGNSFRPADGTHRCPTTEGRPASHSASASTGISTFFPSLNAFKRPLWISLFSIERLMPSRSQVSRRERVRRCG